VLGALRKRNGEWLIEELLKTTENPPQGLKPIIILAPVMARLKPCPYYRA
jgi:hypothetical protein